MSSGRSMRTAGDGEREIVGEIGLIVAQRDHRGDFHAIERSDRTGGASCDSASSNPTNDDPPRPDQSRALRALHDFDEGEAGREHRDKSGDVEDADGAAREIGRRPGREAERQRAQKGEIPRGKAAGELSGSLGVTIEAVVALLGRGRR